MKPTRKELRMRLDAAVAFVAKHGYTHPSISECFRDNNPVVTIHQDWTPKGQEKAVFRQRFGRYGRKPGKRGQEVGCCYREPPV